MEAARCAISVTVSAVSIWLLKSYKRVNICSDDCNSSNRRAFSNAMAAWLANKASKRSIAGEKASCRVLKTPITPSKR